MIFVPRLIQLSLVYAVVFVASALWSPLFAQDMAPDAFIKRINTDALDSAKAEKTDKSTRAGDVNKIIALVDTKVMPHLDFARMTASAVGPAWRSASPEQQKKLQDEFKILLVRTYAGALAQVLDQTVVIKPLRASAADTDLVVRSELRGANNAIGVDYRLIKTAGQGLGWKIINVNVEGVWLIETYRSQFVPEINARGVDGLINSLSERNKANAKRSGG